MTAELEHHVVCNVDHVANGTHPGAEKRLLHPRRGRSSLDIFDDGQREAAAQIGVVDVNASAPHDRLPCRFELEIRLPQGFSGESSDVPRHAHDGEPVGAVRLHVDIEHGVTEHFGKGFTDFTRRVEDEDAAFQALVEGRHDFMAGVPFSLLARLSTAARQNVFLLATEPVGHQAWLRVNHLYPPFDDPRARRSLQILVDQALYMRALVGDHPQFFRSCAAFFGCGTPYADDGGGEAVLGHDLSRARRLLRAAGYEGEEIVLLRPSGIPDIARLSEITEDLLRRAGAEVRVVAASWERFARRRDSREAPENGGWHLFHTLWSAANIADPQTNVGVWAGCTEGAWFGWPCDDEIEALRRRFVGTMDGKARVDIARRIQARAHEVVTYVPLGEFRRPSAYRGNLSGMVEAPVPVFWNIEKR